MSPPHVPEISLHLADEVHSLWQKTEDELEEIGLPPPFWAFAWAGGQGLARYVLDHPRVVRGRRILDFATGSGMVAIAAKLAGARSVLAVDVDPWASHAVAMNALANGVEIDFMGEDLVGTLQLAEVVLAGDVFYDKTFAKHIIPWFSLMAENGTVVLIGDPGRSYLPKDRLEALAVYEVPVTRVLEDSETKSTTVWQFV